MKSSFFLLDLFPPSSVFLRLLFVFKFWAKLTPSCETCSDGFISSFYCDLIRRREREKNVFLFAFYVLVRTFFATILFIQLFLFLYLFFSFYSFLFSQLFFRCCELPQEAARERERNCAIGLENGSRVKLTQNQSLTRSHIRFFLNPTLFFFFPFFFLFFSFFYVFFLFFPRLVTFYFPYVFRGDHSGRCFDRGNHDFLFRM